MAFVPPDAMRGLIREYYRQQGTKPPKDYHFPKKAFLFAKYDCEAGYELIDESDHLFCHNSQWIGTTPICVGKGTRVVLHCLIYNLFYRFVSG